MPVKFGTTPKKDPRDTNAAPKYYAVAKSSGRADTQVIARSINSMSTVSSVDTAAVLEAFLTVVPEKLAEGNIVELGDFGTFRVSLSSQGEPSPTGVTVNSITDAHVIFTPGRRFKDALGSIRFEKEAE